MPTLKPLGTVPKANDRLTKWASGATNTSTPFDRKNADELSLEDIMNQEAEEDTFNWIPKFRPDDGNISEVPPVPDLDQDFNQDIYPDDFSFAA